MRRRAKGGAGLIERDKTSAECTKEDVVDEKKSVENVGIGVQQFGGRELNPRQHQTEKKGTCFNHRQPPHISSLLARSLRYPDKTKTRCSLAAVSLTSRKNKMQENLTLNTMLVCGVAVSPPHLLLLGIGAIGAGEEPAVPLRVPLRHSVALPYDLVHRGHVLGVLHHRQSLVVALLGEESRAVCDLI